MRAGRSFSVVASVLLGLVACAHAPRPAPAEPAPPTGTEARGISEAEGKALAGTWVYAGGDAERAAVDPAVERATADMGFLARGIAAGALRGRALPRDSYALSFEGSTVSIVTPDHPTPLRTKTHSHGYVPFVMAGNGLPPDAAQTYDEVAAGGSPLAFDEGWKLMRYFLDG